MPVSAGAFLERLLGARHSVLDRPNSCQRGPSAPEFAIRLAGLCRLLGFSTLTVFGYLLVPIGDDLAAFYPELCKG